MVYSTMFTWYTSRWQLLHHKFCILHTEISSKSYHFQWIAQQIAAFGVESYVYLTCILHSLLYLTYAVCRDSLLDIRFVAKIANVICSFDIFMSMDDVQMLHIINEKWYFRFKVCRTQLNRSRYVMYRRVWILRKRKYHFFLPILL